MRKQTLARILAARQNGARSRGPVTPEGKRRSAMNALDHGLCAQTLVLPGESAERFADHRQAIQEVLAPQNYLEEILAHRITAAAWKLLRADGFESALVEDQLAVTAPGPTAARSVARAWADSRAPLAAHYEARHQRSLHRNLQAFYGLTLLRGQSGEAAIDTQCIESEGPAPAITIGTNEPKPENTTPESGDLAA